MNRQAIAFISLFSLILMLSVYYVSMDNDDVAVIQPQDHEVVSKLSDGSQPLKDQINEQDQSEIQKQKEILGTKGDSEEKSEALDAIAKLENKQKQQQEYEALLSEQGFKCVVEIDESVVRVTVYEQGKDLNLANQIMNLLYEKVGNEKTIEVSFS